MTAKSVLSAVALSLALTPWAPQVLAQVFDRVQIEYVHPEKFADAGRYWGGDRARETNLAELARHIERRATALLSEGQRLAVSISDVDFAGGYEPWRRGLGDVRVVRDVYPPRIDLRFRLASADGSVLKEGERRLRNLAFGVSGAMYRDDPLRYEKALLEDWLERELRPQATR